jgi:hypothetical protein
MMANWKYLHLSNDQICSTVTYHCQRYNHNHAQLKAFYLTERLQISWCSTERSLVAKCFPVTNQNKYHPFITRNTATFELTHTLIFITVLITWSINFNSRHMYFLLTKELGTRTRRGLVKLKHVALVWYVSLRFSNLHRICSNLQKYL